MLTRVRRGTVGGEKRAEISSEEKGGAISNGESGVCLCVAQSSDSAAHQAPLSVGFSRQESGGGRCAVLQGIVLPQGSNLSLFCLLHW